MIVKCTVKMKERERERERERDREREREREMEGEQLKFTKNKLVYKITVIQRNLAFILEMRSDCAIYGRYVRYLQSTKSHSVTVSITLQ